MTSPADKLRKLMTLANDPSSTAGERAACQAAIERIKKSLPPGVFATVEREARQRNDDSDFLKRAGRRRGTNKAWERHQAQQRAEEFVRQTERGFRQPPTMQQAFQAFDAMWEKLQKQASQAAYPKAYGDRRK
jgi:hypothetical protein